MEKQFKSKELNAQIPHPVCDDYPEFNELYDKAWELAHAHIRHIDGMPQTPYMDEAFCDTQIWIWDTCFMSQFCKYAQGLFPGVESLKNFYEVLYDGKSLPRIIPSEREPDWTGAVPGVESDIYIHIADNPPLFAWSEYENILFSANREHIRELLYEKQYLQKHYAWIEGLRATETPHGVFSETCLIREELGYRWEGGRSGMDNTPRGRKGLSTQNERPNNPNMLWLDAICQQALAAKNIAELFELLGDTASSADWRKHFEEKKKTVNSYYWDGKDKFYYDIDVNTHEFYKVQTAASFWPLLAGIAKDEQAEALVNTVLSPKRFGGDVPLLSLAKNDKDYHDDGRYWRGGLWLPTAYMALKGISSYGYADVAREAAIKIISHMLKTYREFEPHTIWECYAPEYPAPATVADNSEYARRDFCGWSALGPISMYIEFVLGFYKIDGFSRRVEWRKPENCCGNIGIRNLSFGDVITDIVASGGECEVTSNKEYTLVINGSDYKIHAGFNKFKL